MRTILEFTYSLLLSNQLKEEMMNTVCMEGWGY